MNPETATFDINATGANHKDVVFTVFTGEIASVKIGAQDVNSANYTLDTSKKTLTLSKAYLAGLTFGQKTFTIVMTGGDSITVRVTIENTTV